MSKQEENWELMTTLQIPWSECNKIESSEDREFLLNKARELKMAIAKQMEAEKRASSIVTPSNLSL